jgi:arylsulfatase A-like enzyme
LDGTNLLPLIDRTGGQPGFARGKPMIWEFHGYGGQIAVMDGHWKAVRQKVRTRQPGPWELYDLQADRAEANDLAAKHPEVVKRLEGAYREDRTPNPRNKLPLYD